MSEIPAPLLQLLVCPRCHGTLERNTPTTRLECRACQVAYPVRDGIPIMLVEEAEPLRA